MKKLIGFELYAPTCKINRKFDDFEKASRAFGKAVNRFPKNSIYLNAVYRLIDDSGSATYVVGEVTSWVYRHENGHDSINLAG